MASKPQKKPNSASSTRPETSPKDRIIDAALSLAAVQAWEHCSVRDIAQEAGVSIAEFYDHFEERSDIVTAYIRRIDRAVLSHFSEPDYEANPRDRLFDILMERFDQVGDDREGLLSIVSSHRTDPKQVLISLPLLAESMTKMLEAANLSTSGFRGAARVAGLSAGFAWVVRTWAEDDSEDLSKTMAALDKVLGNLERAANTFGV